MHQLTEIPVVERPPIMSYYLKQVETIFPLRINSPGNSALVWECFPIPYIFPVNVYSIVRFQISCIPFFSLKECYLRLPTCTPLRPDHDEEAHCGAESNIAIRTAPTHCRL